jgi:hypothetical protein
MKAATFLYLILSLIMQTEVHKANAMGSKPVPVPSPSAIPVKKNRLKFECQNCSYAEAQKVAAGELILNDIVHGECFEKFMLGRNLVQTGNRSNAQVVAHLRSFDTTIKVNMYYEWFPKGQAVLAYRQPPSKIVYMNRHVFKPTYDSCEWSSTLLHESAHVFGYSHDYERTTRRPNSVPYQLNGAVGACCIR